ncbi:MAG: DnaJ domain-containing protein [Methyloceanibacter sp.]
MAVVAYGGSAVKDLYRILGIGRDAARDEIHRAYRRKAKSSHPDSGGSVGAFGELATAYAVLSNPRCRERYDETGEIEQPRPNNFDASAVEVIAQKLGLIIHAEQDLTGMDIGALIEAAIREDMAERRTTIAGQKRAIERVARLRARIQRKARGDNMLARVLDWHESSTRLQIDKNEAAVASMERALEILKDYAFIEDAPAEGGDEVSLALHDALHSLDQLAAVLKTGPAWCDIDVARPSASG